MRSVALLSTALTASAEDTCVYPDEPATGQAGTRVTISGTDLLGVSGGTEVDTVYLGDYQAAVISEPSATSIVVVAPDGVGSGDITVTANSGARAIQSNAWIFLDRGAISGVAPAFGQYGTRVTIVGDRLLGGGHGSRFPVTDINMLWVEVVCARGRCDPDPNIVDGWASRLTPFKSALFFAPAHPSPPPL
jgi:hypothetical protein